MTQALTLPEELLCEPHPLAPNLSPEQILQWIGKPGGLESYSEWLGKRRMQIREWSPEDPECDLYYTGYVSENWKRAQAELAHTDLLAVFGGNGSAKTWMAAWMGMHKLLSKRGAKVLWLHEAEKASIDVQQAAVFQWMPRKLRGVRRGTVQNTEFTIKNGFPNGRFVLPNRSVGVFGYYGQQVKDYEGGGWDLILADENLPLSWLETLMYRLPRKQGKFVWTFTPIRGITPAIRELVMGARTLEHRRAELLPEDRQVKDTDCPPGRMPYLQRSLRYQARILYFFTEDNPWSGYAQQKRQASSATEEEIERRFYGWARDTRGRMFPNFGPHNILPAERIPKQGVNVLVVDPVPEGPRNWFMLWIRVGVDGRAYVYREWPDLATYGEWAVPTERSPEGGGKGWDGDPGPAQPKLGHGYVEYKELMLRLENGEKIERRLFDPRASGVEILEDHGGVNMVFKMAEPHTTLDGKALPPLYFEQALKVRDDDPIALMDSAMRVNLKEPLDPLMNYPRLLVSESCGNLIWALQNYTGRDGKTAACKDPVDCLKYFFTSDASYGEVELKSYAGGGY